MAKSAEATSCGSVAAEACVIVKLALPSCIASLTFMTSMMTLFFVGQYGTDAIAGAGLGFMWSAVTGNSLIWGSGMGLGTLCSQAFGAKNYRRVGVLMQRQMCYQWLICCGVCVCWIFTEPLLLRFGQPPRVSAFAAQWCIWQLPGLPAMPVMNSVNVFLQSQRIVRPTAVLALLTNFGVTIPLVYWLTRPDVLGFVGAPLSMGLAQIMQAVLLWIVAPRVVKHPTWVPWSRDALSGWVELIRLGVGGAVGMWAEWWAAELMVFLCGILCTLREDPSAACDDVAVTVLLRNFGNSAIGFSWGFSTAACTRVGNNLGEGRPYAARVSALLGGGMQVSVCLSIAAVLVSTVDSWSLWFELEESSVQLLMELLPLGAFYWFGIAMGCGALRSILTAMGLVRFAAVVQLVAFYPIGTLLGSLLAFDKLGRPEWSGAIGLWIGCDLGYVFMIGALTIYYLRVDWEEMARLAQERSAKDAAPSAAGAEGEGDALLGGSDSGGNET